MCMPQICFITKAHWHHWHHWHAITEIKLLYLIFRVLNLCFSFLRQISRSVVAIYVCLYTQLQQISNKIFY